MNQSPEISALDVYLQPLSAHQQNTIFHIFCDIYAENEQLAFRAGVRVGMCLASELEK